MISWAVTTYAGMFGQIEHWIAVFEGMSAGARLDALGHAKATGDISPEWKQMLANFVAMFAAQETKILGLDLSHQMASQLERELRANHRYSPELLLKELTKLKQLIVMESAKCKLAFIPPPYDVYFEQDRLFGDMVYETFPEARVDVKAAGNCLAASLSTASVFHLMRVAEFGLRKLAKQLHVKLTHTAKVMPIEFADWDKVITGIRNEITQARTIPAGRKRQAKLEAYSNAADHCEYMKDIWRNNMAHARKPFEDVEAVRVLERVRDFMQFLGEYLA